MRSQTAAWVGSAATKEKSAKSADAPVIPRLVLFTSTSQICACSKSAWEDHSAARIRRGRRAQRPCAFSGERLHKTMRAAPASASASATAFAAPPAPSSSTRLPAGLSPISVREERKPAPSVEYPYNLSPLIQTVFTEPLAAASGERTSTRFARASLWGMVALKPV
ncbi:hypothetical protein SDC9_128194 [bioreactor metagenome]|uniref:Uncharacterized protein n=1 Tax=bioreactor metagenome TaxID=1076179 RepID=A0A645CWR6_9ZZZZ